MNRKDLRRLAGESVMKRVDAVRHELRYGPPAAVGRWRNTRETKARRKKLLGWFAEIHRNPPDVLVGANPSFKNGIRHHMEGIREYSSLDVALFPANRLLKDISYHDLHTTFRDDVMAFDPAGIGVMHSHVYPYYIEWCRLHAGGDTLWVHTYHAPYFPDVEGGTLEPWEEQINSMLVNEAQHADVRISVSRWQQKYLEQTFGITTEHIPNGVDVKVCDAGIPSRFRHRVGDRPFVLFVGRSEAVKNPDDFVRLAESMPRQRFVMVGPGLAPGSFGVSWPGGLPRNLILCGEISYADVQDGLAACSAVVVTSKHEGFPTLVLEAAAHGKPTIVPNDPGCVEALGGEEFGGVYEPGNIADLALKTMEAVGQRVGGEKARQRILDEFDWRVVAPQLDAIYLRGKV